MSTEPLNSYLEGGTGLPDPTPGNIVLSRRDDDLVLMPAFDLTVAKERLAELQEFVKFYMKEGEDFGTIPGTPKPTLYKPGADKLCDIYALADRYRITNRTEDWERNLFDYEVECTLISRRNERLVATGLGSCNSYEENYRWRKLKHKCPKCGKETVIKGREDYGGGWLCWKKPGKSDGCGAKWLDGAKEIEDQQVGKVQNEEIPTIKNTLLKMAKKRAKIDAVLSATRSSGIFTQDIEDWTVTENGSQEAANAVAERKIAEHEAKKKGVKAESGSVAALFYTVKSEDDGQKAYITGERQLLADNKELLAYKGKWSNKGNHFKMDANDLDDLKYELEQRKVPFVKLP